MTATEADLGAPGTATPKLNKALSQLQGELPQIKKTKTAKIKYQDKAGVWNSHEYSYADLGDVVADVGPLLAKHGLAFHCAPTINPADRREMLLLWSLLHESGEEKTGEWPLGPVNQKPQSLGSAITYGRRYCFTAATNIVLEDDDDGQRAQQDHGGAQSAGDAWEQATPARPGSDDAPYRRLLAAAGAFTTSTGADQVARDASAAKDQRLITRDQCDHVQNLVRTRLDGLRKNARPVAVEDLARAAQDSPRTTTRGTAAAGDDTRNQRHAGNQAPRPGADEHGAHPAPAAAGGTPRPESQPLPPLPAEDHPGSVSPAQLTKLHTVLTGLGFGSEDREQKLVIAEVITGRAPLTGPTEGRSSKNLSLTEARRLIDTLDGMDRDQLIAYMAEHEDYVRQETSDG